MGIHDRDYYRDGSGGFLDSWGRSGVTGWVIGITVAVFIAQALTGNPGPVRSPLVEWGAYWSPGILSGEVWRLFEDLPELARLCGEILSENASFLVLNAYAERISGPALAGLLADALPGRGGRIDWGELALVQDDGAREIGMSFYARWTR